MKSILLIIKFLLFIQFSNSQITKNNWLVGGSASLYNVKLESPSNNSESNGIEIRPNIGYFLKDKFAIGMTSLFAYSKNTNNQGGGSNFGVGGFVRYYFLKEDKLINIISHAGYNKLFSEGQDSSSALDFRAGPVIFFNSSVALELTLNYNLNLLPNDAKFKIFNLGIGFQIHLEK